MTTTADVRLRREIQNLAQYIERFRTEIARINNGAPDTRFQTMSDQLDAIIEHTDSATHNILQNLEAIMEHVGALQDKVGDGEAAELCSKIFDNTTNAMESCTFQDITGQRVTKIVSSMRFVEERVNAMIELMGKTMIDQVTSELPEPAEDEGEKDEYQKYLNGPQLPGEAISQDDIDKLFA